MIVDDYSLPIRYKTVKLLYSQHLDDAGVSSDNGAATNNEEVYGYGGLLFRMIDNPANERDTAPSEMRLKYMSSSDNISHKIAGNEQRGSFSMQRAVAQIYHENITRDNGKAQSVEEVAVRSLKLCTLLSTLVDYAGFRVSVFCPIDIDEETTLVYGHSKTEDIFVNSLPAVRTILPKIAQELNLATTRRMMLITTVPLHLRRSNPVAANAVDLISKDLQAHRCADGRTYLINFQSLLPSDLPRPSTNDLVTHTLRQEFIGSFLQPVSSDTLRGSSEDDVFSAISDSNIQACSFLYSVLLPEMAAKLDGLVAMPVDSYGLTHFFHTHGANMRHLGVVLSLSRTPFVRRILLTEAIARTCKVLLNQTLREIARRGKAESLQAEYRGRSIEENYLEHMELLHKNRRTAVLDMFNLLLGSGEASVNFWRG